MNEACPLLPQISKKIRASDSRALGDNRGLPFYSLCLEYSQSKWIQGFPAQALLQLNRAMSADLKRDEKYLESYPIPYSSIRWILIQRPDNKGQFLGNPRRHWQHYASRMSGPRAEIRIWRAWACFAIASKVLPHSEFPDDYKQIKEEGLIIPSEAEISEKLKMFGLPSESVQWNLSL